MKRNLKKIHNLNDATKIAEAIISEIIPVSEYVIKMAKIHLMYLELSNADSFKYEFDPVLGKMAIDMFQSQVHHVKGMSGPIELRWWQKFELSYYYGWRLKSDTSKFMVREIYLFIPRKEGKSTFHVGLSLIDPFFKFDPGGETYYSSKDGTLANKLFDDMAKNMIDKSEMFKESYYKKQYSIHFTPLNHIFRSMTKDSDKTNTINCSTAVITEDHLLINNDFKVGFKTSMAERKNPLIITETTGGVNINSIALVNVEWLKRAIDIELSEKTGMFSRNFALLFMPTKEEEENILDSPTVWPKFKPSILYNQDRFDDLIRESKLVKSKPHELQRFKAMEFNIFTNDEATAFWRYSKLSSSDDAVMNKYGYTTELVELNDHKIIHVPQLKGKVAAMSIDLSQTKDLTSYSLKWKDEHNNILGLTRNYMPKVAAEKKEIEDNAPYVTYAQQGYITLIPGARIDYKVIVSDILEDIRYYGIAKIGYDPYQFNTIKHMIVEKLGLDIDDTDKFVQVPQNATHQHAAIDFMDKAIEEQRACWFGNKIAKWCYANVVLVENDAGFKKISKKRARNRVDTASADISAIATMPEVIMGSNEALNSEKFGLDWL